MILHRLTSGPGRRQGVTQILLGPRFQPAQNLFRLCFVAVQRQPARTFRHAQAKPPGAQRARRADQRHPAPALHAEGMQRHQQPAQQRHRRHGGERDALTDGEGAAALRRRHQLRQQGVDGHLLQPHPDGGDEAPQIDADGAVLERHDGRGQRIPDQRNREDGAPPHPVGDKAEADTAQPHARKGAEDEKSDAIGREKTGGVGREQAAGHQSRRDIGGHQQVVEFERAAQRDQDHQPPQAIG